MIRLLQAIAGAPRGGAELFILRLAEAFQRRAAEGRLAQQVLIRPHAEALARLRAAGLEPVTARFGGPLDLMTRRRFRQVIEDFRPDIVLTYMSRASATCPAAVPGRPFLQIARLGGYYDMKYYRNCDHLIGISADLVDYFKQQGWPAGRVHLISNYVEPPQGPAAARADHDTPPDVPLLFALGRLHRNKAFDILLDALAQLPDAVLWLAGDGPERQALADQARRLGVDGRVRFLGWQSDPAPYLLAADVYIVPSRHEPLGSVVLEGWAARKPMVAAASQGPSWLIAHDRDGLLVPVDDAPAMAGAIRRLLADPAKAGALAAAGHQKFLAGFTEQAVVDQYLTLFDRLITEKTNRKGTAERS